MSDPTDKDSQPVTVIVPGPAVASGRDVAGSLPARDLRLRWLAVGLLTLMLIVLVGVVVVLPDLVADRVTEKKEDKLVMPPPAPPSPAPSEDARRVAREKREAERLLGLVLRGQTELEAEGVAVWGGEDYHAAIDSLAAGDAELHAERYKEAASNYENAIAELQALRASKAERFAAALAAGDAALTAADGPGARDYYNIALSIEPNDPGARQGMLRARVLEERVALIAAGAEHEAGGELDAAKEKYASAIALDPDSPKARAANERISARIRERDFRNAMSTALAALEQSDFDASRASLARADAIQSGSPEVADARVRLQRAVNRSLIGTHREQAQALERDESWQAASEHYAAVLGIDPQVAFARIGAERSLARVRVHRQFDAYLAALGRLSAHEPRDNARRLLAAVVDLDAQAEPKLAAKAERLRRAIEVAETPMQVRLLSDNLTDVTVYKVGRFGRFASRDLRLPPGTYTAVGTRSGYRDVRVKFTLTVGREPAHISVYCREKI